MRINFYGAPSSLLLAAKLGGAQHRWALPRRREPADDAEGAGLALAAA